jgi:hypothetical protein
MIDSAIEQGVLPHSHIEGFHIGTHRFCRESYVSLCENLLCDYVMKKSYVFVVQKRLESAKIEKSLDKFVFT